jgi:hypothetical protein
VNSENISAVSISALSPKERPESSMPTLQTVGRRPDVGICCFCLKTACQDAMRAAADTADRLIHVQSELFGRVSRHRIVAEYGADRSAVRLMPTR